MKNRWFFLLSCFGLLVVTQPVAADITFYNGAVVDAETVPTMPVEKHFQAACEAYENEAWKEAIREFYIVCLHFPKTNYAKEAYFLLGVCYYNYGEYEYASNAFSSYLKYHNNPDHIDETIGYKFAIAEKFRGGAKRRIFGSKLLPAWMDGTYLAIEIYDEIMTAFPCHELAAQSLFSKGATHLAAGKFSEAIESYQTLIRRFPRHELAPESYVMISRVYHSQLQKEFQNSDILSLAELNLKKFRYDFPTHELLEEASLNLDRVKEEYARGLYETGRFYERISKSEASILYYQIAVDQFPETNSSQKCRERLASLSHEHS